MAEPSSLSLMGVGKTYELRGPDGRPRELEVLRAVTREVARGRFVSLIGPSGCGKSTLFEIVAGLRPCTTGEIRVLGERVVDPHPLLGVIFQEDSTLPWRTVLENVEFGLEVRRVGKGERRERARDAIRLLGLAGFEHAYPAQLSGGMRQRVAIARALVLDPEVLLMDEPFGALDQQTRTYLGDELLRIWERTGKTILFVTHDIQEAAYLSDEVWVMTSRPGQIKEVVPVELPRPRHLMLLSAPAFHGLTGHLWELLVPEGEKARLGVDGEVAP